MDEKSGCVRGDKKIVFSLVQRPYMMNDGVRFQNE